MEEGSLVGGRFKLTKPIGRGTFGRVYAARDLESGTEVAVKLEPSDAEFPQLRFECAVYEALARCERVPRMLWSGPHGAAHALALPRMGPTLEEMFTQCGRRFSLKTVLALGIRMLECIRQVHEEDILHRDIKPDNFVLGRGLARNSVFLIDYGLSKCYVTDSRSRTHIPFATGRRLVGTLRYASLNCHRGIQQSRRDDLESLAYVLLYFYLGALPWQGVERRAKERREASKVQSKVQSKLQSKVYTEEAQQRSIAREVWDRKEGTSAALLCVNAPAVLQTLLEYARSIGFIERPLYGKMQELLRAALVARGWTDDGVFDWD